MGERHALAAVLDVVADTQEAEADRGSKRLAVGFKAECELPLREGKGGRGEGKDR